MFPIFLIKQDVQSQSGISHLQRGSLPITFFSFSEQLFVLLQYISFAFSYIFKSRPALHSWPRLYSHFFHLSQKCLCQYYMLKSLGILSASEPLKEKHLSLISREGECADWQAASFLKQKGEKKHVFQHASLTPKCCFRSLRVCSFFSVTLSSTLSTAPLGESQKTFKPAEIQHFKPNYFYSGGTHCLKRAIFPLTAIQMRRNPAYKVRLQNK